MYKPLINLAASLLALSASTFALADETDFTKPIKVDSASQFVDGINKISLFKTDVYITQGSLVIEADEVEVVATDGEGNEVFIARGNPASYTQQVTDGKSVNAKANEIRYEVSKRKISLKGNAELQQDTSMVRGDSITYDMEKEQMLAQGSEQQNGRVTTVFRPEAIKDLTDQVESKDEDKNDEDQPK